MKRFLLFRSVPFLLLLGSAMLLFAQERASWKLLTVAGIENVIEVSDRLLSGGQPENEQAFANLKKLGVTTIISVDGSRPNLAAAKAQGLRYIHLPVGYDTISTTRQAELLKAMQITEGKLFVHCHHGKHRGPAAAAIIERLAQGWSPEQSRAFMEQAGTSPSYRGLWKSVAECQAISPDKLAALIDPLPELVEPPQLVDTMLSLDDRFEKLSFLTKEQKELSREQLAGCREDATQLTELLREWMRQEAALAKPAEFRDSAQQMLNAAEALEKQLQSAAKPPAILAAATLVSQSCKKCHVKFRDGN